VFKKRKFKRKDISIKIEYRLALDKLGPVAQSRNVSEGGICIPLIRKLGPKAVLNLKIYLTAFKKPIRAAGKIVWTNQYSPRGKKTPFIAGVKFTRLDPADRQKIKKYIETIERIEIEWQK